MLKKNSTFKTKIITLFIYFFKPSNKDIFQFSAILIKNVFLKV